MIAADLAADVGQRRPCSCQRWSSPDGSDRPRDRGSMEILLASDDRSCGSLYNSHHGRRRVIAIVERRPRCRFPSPPRVRRTGALADYACDAAAARPAHLGDRSLQLPLRLLHAARGVRADYKFLRASELLDASRRSCASRASSKATASRRSGSPAASRCCARTSSDLIAMLAGDSRTRPDADDQRLGCSPGKARALKAAGLHRVTVSLDSLDEAVFRKMNDADFPVAEVLERHRRRRRARASRRSRSTWW